MTATLLLVVSIESTVPSLSNTKSFTFNSLIVIPVGTIKLVNGITVVSSKVELKVPDVR